MLKNRWFRLVSGAVAILLAITAVTWVIVPDEAAPSQAGRTLSVASALGAPAGDAQAVQEPAPAGAGPLVFLPDRI